MSEKDSKYINDWLGDIDLGMKYKEKFSSCKDWHKYREYYRGNFRGHVDSVDPYTEVTLNRVFSYIKSAIPRIYFRNPGVLAIPLRPDLVPQARVIEALDNQLIRSTGLKKYLKSAILDTFLCGTGALKLGYDSEFGYDLEQAVDADAGTVSQVSTKDGNRIEYNSNIQPGMPWALRTRPDAIITPYGYSDPNDLPWVAEMVLRPVEDVKADSKYSRHRKDIVGGFTIPHETGNIFSAFRNGVADKGRFALLYEIRNWRTGEFIVLCEEKILYRGEDSLQVSGLPWEFIHFNEDPEHFWGISDVQIFEPQQKELNEIRSHARRMRRLEVLKFIYAKGAFSPENLEKLLSMDAYDMGIGIECNAEHLAASIMDFKPNTNTDGLIREQEQTDSDLRDLLGFSQNQTGSYVPFHNKTAKEASIVDQAAGIRSDERRDVIADVLANIVKKWNQFIVKYWDTPRVVEIVGNDGYQYWVEFTGDQIKGDYFFNIQPEEGMPISREIRHQTAGELFQMLNQDPLIDQIGLRRLLLQQTDIIDPSYMGLLRPPMPNPEMNVSPENPLDMQSLAGMQGPGQALGPQLNPMGGGNAPV